MRSSSTVTTREETRIQHWRRLWHLHGKGWLRAWGIPTVVLAGLLGLLIVVKTGMRRLGVEVEQSHWWHGLDSHTRNFILGGLLEVVGLTFFLRRLKARRALRTLFDLKRGIGEIAMILAGAALLFKALFDPS